MTDITLETTGTITFTNGSNAIVGVGTTFIGLLQGDPVFGPDGKFYELGEDPSSATSTILNKPYAGTTAADAVGGSDWVIFRSSRSRDSVRTATKQLTDITSTYRQVMNLTNSDQTSRLNKALTADRAGLILQKAGLDMFQGGMFEDDEFSIRYLLAATWTKALGIDPASGATSIYSQLLLGKIITVPILTGTTNNLAPSGIDQANVLRISTDAAHTLTGITGGTDGRVMAVMNVGGQELDLENEGGSSDAANRFALTGNTAIPAGGAGLLIYDGAASRWRMMGGSGTGAGEGDKGWSPILGYVANGARIVAQIVDWTGGEGAKPATGAYIGAAGVVTLPADAVSVLGPKGDQVQFRLDNVRHFIQWSYVGTIEWQDLISYSAITGPTSAPAWQFSSTVTDSDPGAGLIRFNHATFGSITQIYISSTTYDNFACGAMIDSYDDSSSLPNRGLIFFGVVGDPSKAAAFQVTGDIVTSGAYKKIPVAPVIGAVPNNLDRIYLNFARTGDKGIPGIIPRGDYNNASSYLVGDVVDVDGSSYISLVQPNLNHAVAPESTNAYWALFARGVNAAFITAINLTLTNATTQATNSATSATASATSAQLSSDWSIKVSGTIDGTFYSAKEYAQGGQASTGGSAKNWASQVGGDVTGATANSRSSKSWAQEVITGATLGGSAKDWSLTTTTTVDGTDWSSKAWATGGTGAGQPTAGDAKSWAIKVSANVDGTSFSAKEYAQGAQAATGGSAKNWAAQTGADVTGASANSRSAKSWAQENIVGATLGGSAKDWAAYIGGTVDTVSYSAKQYALNATASAAAALASETNAGGAATTATTQAGIATTKAGQATTSATNAATSETNALASKNAAATSETNAATSATTATTKAAAAATSETNATAAAATATTALQTFQAVFYGSLSADPTLDPLGNAVTSGDMYWNNSTNHLRQYNGSAWDNIIPTGGAGSGDATGPGSSVSDNFVGFADSTGKVLKDSGIGPSSLGDLAFKNQSSLVDPVAMAIVFGA